MGKITSSQKKLETDNDEQNSSLMRGLVSGQDLDRSYRKRNTKYSVTKRIEKQDIEPFLNDGWEKLPSRKRKFIRLGKPKEIDKAFEDEVWSLFYRMGFIEMNKDSNFVIPRYGSEITKQIDVFAREEQCICLVECKSAEKPNSKRVLDKDIDQLATIRRDIDLSINKHYENQDILYKFKYIWILATKNIILSANDKLRAEKANIKVIDDETLEYYNEFSKHFGHSSKYQFLSDLMPKREIPHLIDPIPAIKGTMGNTNFFSFVMQPENLLKIAYIAHRSKTNVEALETYQRMAKKSRLNKIAHYIHEEKGIFPTNIVINFEKDNPLRFDQAAEMAGKNAVLGTLYIPNIYQCAWIIDGQHRLFAYSDLEEAKTATIPVIAFENLDPKIQAQLFIDINGEQVRVPKSHLMDLYANLHWGSENPELRLDALIAQIVKKLDTEKDSPLKNRLIKIGGNKTKTRNLTLTGLSIEIIKDHLIGSVLNTKTKDITPGPLYKEDLDSTLNNAVEVLSGYYSLFLKNDLLKMQWDIGSGEGGYICTNLGIQATLRVLKSILDHLQINEQLEVRKLKTTQLMKQIEKFATPVITFLATAPSPTLLDLRRSTGESGVKDSTFILLSLIKKQFPQFESQGLKEWLKKTDTTNNAEARTLILDKIEPMLHEYIFKSLKTRYGDERTQWWFKVNSNIRTKAMKRADEEGELIDFEKFIDLIDLKNIIEDNIDIFEETFTIDAKISDSRAKRLSWFTKLNDIRKKVAHTIKSKGVSDEELDFVKHIYEEIRNKIGKSPIY